MDPIWSRISGMLLTYPGRRRLMMMAITALNPIWSTFARLYRRIIIRNTRFIAVVGTYGKSTTTRALSKIISGKIHRYTANSAGFFVSHAVLRTRPGARHGVAEVSIRAAGEMAGYARIVQPDIVLVTSIGSEHHTSFRTLETTRNEKADMVRILPESGLAVLNGDDPNVLWMKGQTKARVITFGFGKKNDVIAENLELNWPHGINVHIKGFNQRKIIRTPLLGRPGAYVVLGTTALGLSEGYSWEDIASALESFSPTVGRLETAELGSGAWLVRDEFKGNVETTDVALDVLGDIPASRRIDVIGMVSEPKGSQGELYRRLGAHVAQVADRAIFIGSTKQRHSLRTGAIKAGLSQENISCFSKAVPDALKALPEPLDPGDVILVKGRGSQRLDRISLALMGKDVKCDIKECTAVVTRCHHCKMLERGREDNRLLSKTKQKRKT